MKRIILSVIALSTTACVALAQTPPPEKGHGKGHEMGRMFKQADTDGDNAISRAEFDAFRSSRQKEMFKAMDANKDGQISADEFKLPDDRGDMMFMRLDANHDDKITAEEFQAGRRGGEKTGHENPDMPPPPPGEGGPGTPPPPNPQANQ